MNNKKHRVEIAKEASNSLRGTLKEELIQDKPSFENSSTDILKFHGIYQQDDRDRRLELRGKGAGREYIFMVRTKIPGGKITAAQYLKLDGLAASYGNNSLRITTRQGIQFHGVIKRNLKSVISNLNRELITTFGACGDVERNVMTCPAPLADRVKAEIQEYSKAISDSLLPSTKAYHEIWMNGSDAASVDNGAEPEPIYGKAYLPRKFKTAIAFPGDNCVDIYSQDAGLVAHLDNGVLTGFNILVGGGLGMTHNMANTYPVLAKPLGYAPKKHIIAIMEVIVKVQRDFGNRENRKRARMKYLIEEKGVDWMRQEIKKYAGFDLEPVKEFSFNHTDDHLGWHEMPGWKLFLGVFVENGRIKDFDSLKLKKCIREIAETFNTGIIFTPQQNILFTGINKPEKEKFENILRRHGVKTEKELKNIVRWSMACPALPTCGLAITESERVLPAILNQLEGEIDRLGLQNEKISIRMTGCPNGCSRPYLGDIGLVGSGQDAYALFLGGDFEGTRLSNMVSQSVKTSRVAPVLISVLEVFCKERIKGESFGDFCLRIGINRIREITNLT